MPGGDETATGGFSDGTRRHALQILAEALGWRAHPVLWRDIAEAVEELWAAAGGTDSAALAAATTELEAVSPERANPAGQDSGEPPPKPVRERIVETQHRLGKEKK